MNVYNAPVGGIRDSEAAKALTSLPADLFSQPTLLAGDFNLPHPNWQPSLRTNFKPFAETFASWLNTTPLVLLSEPDRATHDRGNVLDLTFITGSLLLAGASTVVAYDLDSTSDHRPLLSTIPWDKRYSEPSTRLRFDTLDQALFLSLLAQNLPLPLEQANTPEDLDAMTSSLTAALHSAYQSAAKRTHGPYTGQPWWNKDCTQFRQLYRIDACTRRDF